MSAARPCIHCEREINYPPQFEPERIASLAAQIKVHPSLAASEDEYKKRLAACKSCEALREEVLCFHCGCFIFVRARAAKNYCPHPEQDKWRCSLR